MWFGIGSGKALLGEDLRLLSSNLDSRWLLYYELLRSEQPDEVKARMREAYDDLRHQEKMKVLGLAVTITCSILAVCSVAIPVTVLAASSYVVFLAAALVAPIVYRITTMRRCATSETLVFLEYLLYRLSSATEREYAQLAARLETSKLLRRLSFRIDWNINAQYVGASRYAKVWARRHANNVARQYMEYSRWLLTPTPLTRTDLIHRLSMDLLNVVRGSWEQLGVEPSGSPRGAKFRQFGRGLLKTIAIAVLAGGAGLGWTARSSPPVAVAIIAVAFILAGIIGGPTFAGAVSILGSVADSMKKIRAKD